MAMPEGAAAALLGLIIQLLKRDEGIDIANTHSGACGLGGLCLPCFR